MALRYKVTFPPVGAPDVENRELHVEVDGADAMTVFPVSAATGEFLVEQNKAVKLWLVDVDDAGNKSPASPSVEFTSNDTLPPPAPNAPVVELIGEE